jgi:hypothetical protein
MLDAIDPAPLAGGSRADVESVHAAERRRNSGSDRPTQPQDDDLAPDILDLRFRRDIEALHRLGARAVYELLVELGRERLIRTAIEVKVRRYAALDPTIMGAVGGDRFPAAPLHLVQPDG